MSDHVCGIGCSTAAHLAALSRRTALRARLNVDRVVPVKTWCRICGVPVLLEVIDDYDEAVRHFYGLDDTSMVHKSVHVESGGWGVHWRLDEVLMVLFPSDHMDDLWPMPPWWESKYGEPMSDDQGVLILSQDDLASYQDRYVDMEVRMLQKYVNRCPKERGELEELHGKVMDTREVSEKYEILGFKSPFAIAVCKENGDRGSLIFQNFPRYYFSWDPARLI